MLGNAIGISRNTIDISGNAIAITKFQGLVDEANYQFPFIFGYYALSVYLMHRFYIVI
jgi:hypothetical protein